MDSMSYSETAGALELGAHNHGAHSHMAMQILHLSSSGFVMKYSSLSLDLIIQIIHYKNYVLSKISDIHVNAIKAGI